MSAVEIAVEIVGWAGAALILLAYLLLSAGKLTGQSMLYQGMNVVGAVGFVDQRLVARGIAVGDAQRVWMMIGLFALIRIVTKRWRQRRRPMTRIVDLSHVIEDGMVTYKGLPGPHICDFWDARGIGREL